MPQQQQYSLNIAGHPALLTQADTPNGARITIHPPESQWPENIYQSAFDAATRWCRTLIENSNSTGDVNATAQRDGNDIAITAMFSGEENRATVTQGVETLRTMLASLTLTQGAGVGAAGGLGGLGGGTEEGSYRGDRGGIEELTTK